ncbi:hypothetical protein MKW94_009550 [Papaver nudicaule]|uniref:Probable purine permease n=1 Tax=Papaver nudicaule TaxID=74823 RepID=A0AA41S4M8_PAPNU|nr:hypothetical protein [Papaver nudicaule]
MNINSIEEGGLTKENKHDCNKEKDEDSVEVTDSPKVTKWGLLLLSCAYSFSGIIGGPLLQKLYFLHGGSGKWLTSWLQVVAFPILSIPLTILYCQRDQTLPNIEFFASRKLLLYASLIGSLQGIDNFMYSYGLAFLPVSTSSLVVATQLVFTSLISFVWVKHNSVLLGIRRSGDRPPGVTNSQYLLGFFISIAVAAILGVILVSTQVSYAKANQAMTYPIVLQFQVCMCFFATIICTIGGLINKDFSLVLVSNMIVWQLMFIGRVGSIWCTSSLFAGVVGATALPFSQITAVITFHENFTAEKGMALALTLWGFASYFYGSYRKKAREQKSLTQAHETC